jgi:internalin A
MTESQKSGQIKISRELRPVLLRLMEKFDLSYRIEGENASLIPELLPFSPTVFSAWCDPLHLSTNECQLSMDFEMNSVPAGVMSWFIVRTHRFTVNKHWREGVYLKNDNHVAKAELDLEKRLFTLAVQGITPQYFFGILMDSVDLILKRFPGLKVERKVPCICHAFTDSVKACTYKFSFENLISRYAANKDTAECQLSYTQVPISRLLFGIHPSTMEAVISKLEKMDNKADSRYNELSNIILRNFLKIHNELLAHLEADCPSLLTITPRESGLLKTVINEDKSLFLLTYDVQLWCQMPGCAHPIDEGTYELKKPKEWLIKLKSPLSRVINSLKYVELASAVSGGYISKAIEKLTKDKLKLMEKVVELIPEDEKLHESLKSNDFMKASGFYGANLRVIYNLLDFLDKGHFWGGLSKTTSPEGDILWLCPNHYKIFDPGLPELNKTNNNLSRP